MRLENEKVELRHQQQHQLRVSRTLKWISFRQIIISSQKLVSEQKKNVPKNAIFRVFKTPFLE
jgi:alpha-amylase/alpha-mannosidase (GH57 family)